MKAARITARLALGAAIMLLSGRAFAANDYIPPKVDTTTPTGVNLADGSFIYSQTDLSIGPLSLERFHLGGAKDPNHPFFGPRMTHSFDIYVAVNTTDSVPRAVPPLPQRYKPVVHIGASSFGTYERDTSGSSYVTNSSDDAATGILAVSGSAYVFTAQDGTSYTFDPAVPVAAALNTPTQRVANIVFPDGRTQTFSYNATGQLKEVSDTSGYALIFDYTGTDAATATVSAACGFDLAVTFVTSSSTCASATLKTGYGYTGGLLTGVTDVLTNVTTYGYSGSEISCIKPPGYTTCKIANTYAGAAYQVTQQNLADGSIWKYAYSGIYNANRDPNLYVEDNGTTSTVVTDPANDMASYSFTKSSPYTKIDSNGHVTQYRYTGGNDYEWQLYPDPPPSDLAEGSMLAEVDYPEGNKYLAVYNQTHHNAISSETFVPKPGSGLSNAVIQYGYAPCSDDPATLRSCTKPTSKIDAKGNETDWTYYDFGGMKSEMQPAPASGGTRPLKLYTFVQKSASIKNASGTLVSTGAPIWLPASETDCETDAGATTPVCGSSSLQIVTTYDYGADGTADNLLLRDKVVAADGTTRRTCYTYDHFGNRVSETQPLGAATSCP